VPAGWVKLRRGLVEHLPDMTAQETHVFVAMLLLARATGRNRGVLSASDRELARCTGLRRESAANALKRLIARGFVERLSAARNQHQPGKYLILKFHSSAGTESGPAAESAGLESGPLPDPNPGQHGTENEPASGPADPSNGIRNNDLQTPKKVGDVGEEGEGASAARKARLVAASQGQELEGFNRATCKKWYQDAKRLEGYSDSTINACLADREFWSDRSGKLIPPGYVADRLSRWVAAQPKPRGSHEDWQILKGAGLFTEAQSAYRQRDARRFGELLERAWGAVL